VCAAVRTARPLYARIRFISTHGSTENFMYIGGGILGTLLLLVVIIYILRRA
jgi:sensor c-di-GMP phosphodiesterase-like protein